MADKAPPVSQRIKFDDANDIVIIDGVRVSSGVLNAFITPTRPGSWFRVLSRNEFGVVTIETRADLVEKPAEQGAPT